VIKYAKWIRTPNLGMSQAWITSTGESSRSWVTGEDCFVGRLYMRTIEELDSILDRFHENARTNTAIVKGQPVKRRLPPLISDR
jgi:hypothetical protein